MTTAGRPRQVGWLTDLKLALERMRACLAKPVLTPQDFPEYRRRSVTTGTSKEKK